MQNFWRDQTRELPVERKPRQHQNFSDWKETKDENMICETFLLFIFCLSLWETAITVLQRSLKYLILYAVRQSIILLWCIFIKSSDTTQRSEHLFSCCIFMKQVTFSLHQAWMDRNSNNHRTFKVVTDVNMPLNSGEFTAMPVSLMYRDAAGFKLNPKTRSKSAWLFSLFMHTLSQITGKSTCRATHAHTRRIQITPVDMPRQHTHEEKLHI